MKPNSQLKFELYRYQINPIKNRQLELFGEQITFQELKERKNEIFAELILDSPPSTIVGKGTYLQKSYYKEQNMYLYKFASKKQLTHHTKDLEDEVIEDYPFIYLIFNNDSQSQTVAISKNYKAFNSSETVASILESYYGSVLINHDLTFSLTPILDKFEYWNVIEKYQGRITQIRFDVIRPNITNLSKALKDGVKKLATSTNSHKTRIELNAPNKHILEDIDQSNDQIVALSDYSVEGGGEVTLKAKGVKGRIKTNKSIRTYQINNIQIEGSPENIAKTLKNITQK